ncbi:MAG TPA: amylo-alpha-1,6-glucosidase [Candidatus Acidoferrum sp.]|nr:amylo-alpha-1,6-glucosidase [Candidatus Acidoferrum sp.]
MAIPQSKTAAQPSEVRFGREICGQIGIAESREWLVTNGIGGFASGTIATCMTRRYHGVLIAALRPPLARHHLVAALDETAQYLDSRYPLATHHWSSGAIAPQGYVFLEAFRLEGTTPVWTYALADALLEKRVWMQQGENTAYVRYTLLRANASLQLDLKALVNYRDFHSSTHAGDWRMQISPADHGVMVLPFEGAAPFYLRSAQFSCEPRHEWYRDCFLPMEKERGLDDLEDHLFAALFHATLHLGESVTIAASTEPIASLDAESSLAALAHRQAALLDSWAAQNTSSQRSAPAWLPQLLLAADQFIVKRSLPGEPDGHSLIAGYPWFGDWGRDTMISLPGLTLLTGRPAIARQILLAFARYLDGGMLPNNFPDAGGTPQYNSVDAALWYFEAVRQYFAATNDTQTLAELFPSLSAILDAYLSGTRYNIHADPADGLLFAGSPGIQLTWMDAKIGDWVVTPRIGKPVEVNALWINALQTMAQFARVSNQPAGRFERVAAQAASSFQKFWNADRSCCFDVLDSPGSGGTAQNDPSLRPNQIFAISLPVSPLSTAQQKSVVDVCARRLLTSYGLRSLAPGEPGYCGRYAGDQRSRDSAYHQGTVWGWLLGSFALAHFRVYQDRVAAVRFLEPLANHISAFGLGTLPEIFDGDPPHSPRGCIAQAWTVAELLRAWSVLSSV